MDWALHVTVATVVERDGSFLLVEEHTKDGRLVYNQPAGHLEDNETLINAAVRETLEETAWEVEPTALVGVYQWRHPAGETFMRFCFTAEPRRHYPDQALDAGIERALWLRREEIIDLQPRLRSPMVLRCLDDYLAGRRYPLATLTAL